MFGRVGFWPRPIDGRNVIDHTTRVIEVAKKVLSGKLHAKTQRFKEILYTLAFLCAFAFNLSLEALAKLALKAKFDDFDVGSIFRKLTYPIGHRRFAKNSNPTLKAQIWPQMEFCKSLSISIFNTNGWMQMTERSYQPELMDLGPAHYTSQEYEDCLKQLGRIGKFIGGDRATFYAIDQLTQIPQTILDVGCGGGSFARRLAKRYPQAKVVGIDISKEAIDYANRQSPFSNLFFQLTETPTLDYPSNQFDLVTATLVCHHLTDEELVAFLQQAVRVAKHAVIINDLHRHPIASSSFAIIAPIFFRNRLICHDGLLSIKRAFKRRDWIRYLESAGISPKRVSLTWHWAFRWILSIDSSKDV
jgi:2-polyprenyl-3-methyl-5-hydroxy-6-metoxy-1,4-benzoquinol methylase